MTIRNLSCILSARVLYCVLCLVCQTICIAKTQKPIIRILRISWYSKSNHPDRKSSEQANWKSVLYSGSCLVIMSPVLYDRHLLVRGRIRRKTKTSRPTDSLRYSRFPEQAE